MGKLNYTNRKVEGLKLGQIVCKDLLKRVPPGTGTKAALRDPVIELNVGHRALTDEGVLELISGLKTSLAYCTPEGEGPAPGVSTLTRLEELCLAGGRLTARVLGPLSEVIRLAAADLQDLDLSDNNICIATTEDAKLWETFLRSFKGCHVLRRLDLSKNSLGPRGFEILAREYMGEERLDIPPAHEDNALDDDEPYFDESLSPRVGNQVSMAKKRRMSKADADQRKVKPAEQGAIPARLRKASNKNGPPEVEFRRMSISESSRVPCIITQGLRSVPYVILSNTAMNDTCALHLSYVLNAHYLPETLLRCVPPAKLGSASNQLDAYNAKSGCKGLVYLPNGEMTAIGVQIFEECEKARIRLEAAENELGARRSKLASKKASEVASLLPERRRISQHFESGSIGSSPPAAGSSGEGHLERLRNKAQVKTIKDYGVSSVELWGTAFRLLTVARCLLLKDGAMIPRPPPQEPAASEGERQQGNSPRWVKLSLAEIMAEQSGVSRAAAEIEASSFAKSPPSSSRSRGGRRISESVGSRGPILLGSGISDAHFSLKSINPLSRRLALVGGLPKEIWWRILAEAIDPNGVLHEDQQRSVMRFAWSRETLHRAKEVAGKSESAQIWHVLEAMDSLAYRESA
ncbi:MAG: hypothetical protein M4579_002777 [Chaenotheca gracillima]|nr:MAG: hypothetical protein M4579_002777 [Chaenotheca gracillima]